MMHFGGGAGIVIKGNTEIGKGFFDDTVVLVNNFGWGNPFLFCLHGDGHSVLVAPTYKGHILAL